MLHTHTQCVCVCSVTHTHTHTHTATAGFAFPEENTIWFEGIYQAASEVSGSVGRQDAKAWSPCARACSWSAGMAVIAEAGATGDVPDSDWPKGKWISWDASSGTIKVDEGVASGCWFWKKSAKGEPPCRRGKYPAIQSQKISTQYT